MNTHNTHTHTHTHAHTPQGLADNFYPDQLLSSDLEKASEGNANVSLDMRMQEGYDHSYFFIASFVAEHVAFHAAHLKA